ncbi:MAG: hypothetical protein HY279_13195 [Nitrospinae bacterium]|nr:hypothetical protein [Nitrospinota bacterium]
MTFWQIIAGIAPLAVIFGLFTLIIHIYQARILQRWREESREDHRIHEETMKKWRDESREDHKTHEETLKYVAGVAERVAGIAERVEEGNKYIAGVAERVEESQKYIADLVVAEGKKTREVIQDRF